MNSFEPKQFGRFFLLERLAVGGMAEIYKAKTYGAEGFEKLLAIKRILPHCSADTEFIRMLIDEAKLSVLLSHANIVQTYDLGKVGEDFFIAMEFISGVNLRDILYRCRDRKMLIPPELAVYIVSEICKGLDYAHRKTDAHGNPLGIVHRDVSPQNILISYEGEVKIVDFGIAKAAMNISHTMAGILKGKIAYMSPEQALGKPIDPRTDVFSNGIILYECLTGQKLFTGESQFEVLKKIRTTKVSATKLPEHLPAQLRNIIATALAYFPKDRYQSAGDMQSDLTRYLYSAYVDFTPQRLAAYVRELFAPELAQQKHHANAQHQRKQVTASLTPIDTLLPTDDTDAARASDEPETGAGRALPGLQMRSMLDERSIATTSPAITMPPEHSISTIERPLVSAAARARQLVLLVATIGVGVLGWWWYQHRALRPQLGSVRIESEPSHAELLLDETALAQTTPAVIENLQVGHSYHVTVRKAGFLDDTQVIAPSSSTPITITVALRPSGIGTIDLTPTPAPSDSTALIPVMSPSVSASGAASPSVSPTAATSLQSVGLDHTLQTVGVATPTVATPAPSLAATATPTNTPNTTVISTPTVAPSAIATPPPTHAPSLQPSPTKSVRAAPTPRVSRSPSVKSTPTPRPTVTRSPNASPTPRTKPTPTPTSTSATSNGGQGAIIINSRPKGATVLIDGRNFGRTPLTVKGLAAGKSHTVRLENSGYTPWSSSVRVDTGGEAHVNATLNKE